jgi:DNA polymerase-3 subunit gamma/tau
MVPCARRAGPTSGASIQSARYTQLVTYLVLARKYRPRTFADVVAQDVATETLRGAIQEERIGHAYLFCGPRGTGKTTTARIFAKALNCEKGPTPDPCGACERCRAADDGSEVDIVEIDAASNRGIDDIRGLRESASYRPMRARFKIFIVDEAHMLTKEAVNAFLKTLEEPPPHVKLFFATTEPEKLLPTFVSRCQIVRLALLPEAAIASRLAHVFEKEGIRAGSGVAEELARRSRGGLRDALSLADQLLSLVGGEPELADLARLSGGAGREEIESLLDLIEAGDRAGALAALPASEGTERELLSGLLASLRACLLAGLSGADHPLLDAEIRSLERMRARFERLSCDRIQVWLAELLRARERIELLKGVSARLVLETALLDLCRAETSLPLAEIAERLLALEARLETGAPQGRMAPAVRPSGDLAREPARAPTASVLVPRAGETDASSRTTRREPAATAVPDTWDRLLAALDGEVRTIGEILRAHGRLEGPASGRAVIRLSGLRQDERALVCEPRNTRIVSVALTKIFGHPVEASLQVAEAPAGKRTDADLFTQGVAATFEGKIVEGT